MIIINLEQQAQMKALAKLEIAREVDGIARQAEEKVLRDNLRSVLFPESNLPAMTITSLSAHREY